MSKPDWEAIETAYRAGVMSLREIASQHGISEGATGTGNYWDPHGEPQFLTKGANDERDNVDAVMRKELSL